MGFTLQELVDRVPAHTQDGVEYAKREFTRNIHSILRAETGFRLSTPVKQKGTSRRSIPIPVQILPGVPEELENLIIPDDQDLPLKLAPWRRELEHFVHSGDPLSKQLLPALDAQLLQGRDHAFPPSIDLALELLEIAKKSRLIEIIFSQEQTYLTDFLGTYSYRWGPALESGPFEEHVTAKIRLYWGVIGICASELNVSVEGLALKVLAHEWGHAYSHVATDIDGRRWESEGFSGSDLFIKEGIAQYCALKVVDELEHRIPDAKMAYERLLPRQPPQYRAHLDWLEFSPEEIRHAMLLARRSGKTRINSFLGALKDARERLR